MQNQPPLIYRLLRRFTLICSVCVVLLMMAVSAVSTCTLRGDLSETTFFLSKSILPKAALLFLTLLVFCLLRIRCIERWIGRLTSEPHYLERVRRIATLCLALTAFFWLCVTQPTLVPGQSEFQTAAEQLNLHDLTCVLPGGFLSRHPDQIGSVLAAALVQRVIGHDNYIIFQLINVGMAAISFYLLSRLACRMHFSGTVQIGTFLAGLIFFPYLFYSTMIYSTIPSVALSLLAFYLADITMETPRTGTAAGAALSSFIALFLNQSVLVFFLALLIFTLLASLRQRSAQHLFLPAMLLAAGLAAFFIPKAILRLSTGTETADGISNYAYLAMGTQDGERAPGWNNGYAETTFIESGNSTAIQKERALGDYSERIAYWGSHPADSLRFFLQKTASQWNNPTFKVFWINEVRSSCIRTADWVNRISRPTGVDFLTDILNPVQFLLWFFILIGILTGILSGVPSGSDRYSGLFCLPLFIFCAGFIFQSVFVADCLRTLPYFVLLFPYAARGACSLCTFIRTPASTLKSLSPVRIICLLLLVSGFFLLSTAISRSGMITGGNAEYAAYLTEVRYGQ